MSEEISIVIRLFGVLRDRLPAGAVRGEMRMTVPLGTDVAGVLGCHGITFDGSPRFVVLVNGRQVGTDHILEEGDIVSAFAALAGG